MKNKNDVLVLTSLMMLFFKENENRVTRYLNDDEYWILEEAIRDYNEEVYFF